MLCFNMILTGKCNFSEFTPANTDLFYNLTRRSAWPGCGSGAAAGGDGSFPPLPFGAPLGWRGDPEALLEERAKRHGRLRDEE